MIKTLNLSICVMALFALQNLYANGNYNVRYYGNEKQDSQLPASVSSNEKLLNKDFDSSSDTSHSNKKYMSALLQGITDEKSTKNSRLTSNDPIVVAQYRQDIDRTTLTSSKELVNNQNLKALNKLGYSSNTNKSISTQKVSFRIAQTQYDSIIDNAALRHGVDKNLVRAMMHTESSFEPFAISPVGAKGLMQLMPATAKRFNVSNIYDPYENIEGGVKYLKWLKRKFNGNVKFMIAAYNAGEGAVLKYGGIPPYKETQDYVTRVLSRYNQIYNRYY